MEKKKKSKQKMQVTTPGFEPAPQLPPAQKAKPQGHASTTQNKIKQ